jgi:hypothetical protein
MSLFEVYADVLLQRKATHDIQQRMPDEDWTSEVEQLEGRMANLRKAVRKHSEVWRLFGASFPLLGCTCTYSCLLLPQRPERRQAEWDRIMCLEEMLDDIMNLPPGVAALVSGLSEKKQTKLLD